MTDSTSEIEARLEQLVARCFGDAVAVERIEPMAGDASTRRYFRVWLDGSGAPPTLVAMVMEDAEGAVTSDEIGDAGDGAELPYINVHHFLDRCSVDVPRLYLDATADGVLLLEDIGDTALWDAVAGADDAEVRRLFDLAIEQLLRIQVDGTALRDSRCLGFRRNFDERLYEWEFEHFLEWGFSGRIEGQLSGDEAAELRRHFREIAVYLGQQPRVLNHRDFHAWNLFVRDGGVRVIDFQDLLLAAAPYDLATLLGDRVTPEVVHADLERQLVADYAEAWSNRPGAPWSWDEEELWAVYTSCALQKAFKVVGRFHYLDRVKGKPGYLRFLPPTLARIRSLLGDRADLAPVAEILRPYFPELRP